MALLDLRSLAEAESFAATGTWDQAASTWAAEAGEGFTATASFAQVQTWGATTAETFASTAAFVQTATWAATAAESFAATASYVQAAAAWSATAAETFIATATFAQGATWAAEGAQGFAATGAWAQTASWTAEAAEAFVSSGTFAQTAAWSAEAGSEGAPVVEVPPVHVGTGGGNRVIRPPRVMPFTPIERPRPVRLPTPVVEQPQLRLVAAFGQPAPAFQANAQMTDDDLVFELLEMAA